VDVLLHQPVGARP